MLQVVFYLEHNLRCTPPTPTPNTSTSATDKFDFIGAELLKVQIRKNWFGRWMSDGDLEKDVFILPHPKYDGTPIEINYYVLKKKYSEELGLNKNENESRLFDEETLI